MIRRDLLTGHWKPYLERAICLKPCYDEGINGGEVHSCPIRFYDFFDGHRLTVILLASVWFEGHDAT